MVTELSYDANISLEEALERLSEVQEVFKGYLLQHDSSKTSSLPSEANRELADCIGVLLPLTHQPSVQKEVLSDAGRRDCVFYRAGELSNQILQYVAGFDNTGVEVSPGGSLLD